MPNFSNEDYLNLIIIYGECHKNINRTLALFNVRFPTRQRPTRKILKSVLESCRTHGSFTTKRSREKPVTQNEENEINVLAFFEAYPTASINDAEKDLRITCSSIHTILKKHKFKAFSYQLVHHLQPQDPANRVQFCEFILIKCQEDADFLANIIWSDEAKFMKNGMFNRHNSHYWATENPHVVRERNFQDMWSFNVFCALKYNKIFCYVTYEENLNGVGYLAILNTVVENALDDLPLHQRRIVWYQHDGAPAHNYNLVGIKLDHLFDDRWFANNGPQLWPPRSPDLTPLDFFLWGHIKQIVYADPITTKEDMLERVHNALQSVTPEQIRAATGREVFRRVQKCLEQNGHRVEGIP